MLDEAAGLFRERFGAEPDLRIRAPGRVNLIGDHTDYNGLPVFPMAIAQHIALAAGSRPDGRVRLVNVDSRFEAAEFDTAATIEASDRGHWANYVKAAAQALVRAHGPLAGVDLVVAGTIPQAAGLASSSALVVAVALAMLAANDIDMELRSLAALLADAEHYVGTRGGGMDQAICLGAQAGTATRIAFRPLRLSAVALPPDWRVLVGFSGVRVQKSEAARDVYNRRVFECDEAFATVADTLALPPDRRNWPALLEGRTVDELRHIGDDALEAPLAARFRHVVGEARRVDEAVEAMTRGDRAAFGRLMTASHASLRTDYEISCPELDELVSLALDAGADGARLTGAGLGGCVVALATAGMAPIVDARWREAFLDPRGIEEPHAVFIAEAAGGAEVVGG